MTVQTAAAEPSATCAQRKSRPKAAVSNSRVTKFSG
jgi:hypothetical protein